MLSYEPAAYSRHEKGDRALYKMFFRIVWNKVVDACRIDLSADTTNNLQLQKRQIFAIIL